MDATNQDTPVAWMVDRYWHDGSWLDTELHFRKPEPHPDIRTRTKFTALYSSDQLDLMRERAERAEAENTELRAGIKRLSDEEELCAETTGEDPFSLVYLAAKLEKAERRNANIMAGLKNVVMIDGVGHYVNDAVFNELQSRALALDAVVAALEFYANPEIYRPHPHGPAFDRRDLSFHARDALTKLQDTSHD